MQDNDAAAILLLFSTGCIKEEDPSSTTTTTMYALVGKEKKKKLKSRPRLTMRKYAREKREQRRERYRLTTERLTTHRNCPIPSEDEIFEVAWEDGQLYDCRIIDFLQVDDAVYYDVKFIEDDVIMPMVEAAKVYPLKKCRSSV